MGAGSGYSSPGGRIGTLTRSQLLLRTAGSGQTMRLPARIDWF